MIERQRLLMIFGGAGLCAALLTWFLWAKTKAPKTEELVSVVAAARDLPAGTKLKKSDIRMVQLAAKDAPPSAARDEKLVLDRALLYPVSANEPLTGLRMASLGGIEGVSANISPGRRAVSVQISDSSGAAGLIQPRAHVDVLFTRTGSMAEALTSTILQDVTVLSVGRATESQPIDAKAARPNSYAVTLLVSPEEAGKLELAKNQGKISLALRNPLDTSRVEDPEPVTGDALDPYLGRPKNKMALRLGASRGIKDPKAWAALTGEEEPKKAPPAPPKVVVDVYRGDKHMQEVFNK